MRFDRSILVGSLLVTFVAACSGHVTLGGANAEATRDGFDAGLGYDVGVGDDSGRTTWDSGVADGPSTAASIDAAQCLGLCVDPAGATATYHSIQDVQAALQGRWLVCGGSLTTPTNTVGIEFDIEAARVYLLVYDNGKVIRGPGDEYVRTLSIEDASLDNGPGSYQINFDGIHGGLSYSSTYSPCPRRLHLAENTSGNRADFVAEGVQH